MIILEHLTDNIIKFIPRKGVPVTMGLRDEQTKEVTIVIPSFIQNGYYTEFLLEEDLIENRKYQMIARDATGKALYKGLVHVITNQTIEEYTTDLGEYQEPVEASTTKYKIIE